MVVIKNFLEKANTHGNYNWNWTCCTCLCMHVMRAFYLFNFIYGIKSAKMLTEAYKLGAECCSSALLLTLNVSNWMESFRELLYVFWCNDICRMKSTPKSITWISCPSHLFIRFSLPSSSRDTNHAVALHICAFSVCIVHFMCII